MQAVENHSQAQRGILAADKYGGSSSMLEPLN